MPVDGDDQVGASREMAVDRTDAHAGPDGDVTHRSIDAGVDEGCGGGLKQRLLVALGVGPLPRSWWVGVTSRHVPVASVTMDAKRNQVPYRLGGTRFRFYRLSSLIEEQQ
ncbi:hypothetical protein Vlu01_04480 [Micromonospora lutea]|uniref:Uncharacterized protein n=1 Tax=Micromonospora lutea TaxID=419825 RepID=A0ABQ4IPJ8_9ACTN|nr:hypothetical protein Vlu01_04480 [Micromonospora lutea]